MQRRVCFQLQVRPERIDEYRDCHAAVWPEMLDALRAMEQTQANARWQAEMAPFFQGLEGRRPDEGLVRLDEIFHLQ